MSQIATFNYLKDSDVAFLGFWSKPKPRLFRKPESKFDDFLQKHVLREQSFGEADGAYVALVFAWLESLDRRFSKEADPVIETVRRNLGGSHWLLQCADQRLIGVSDRAIAESDWSRFLAETVGEDRGFDRESFELARRFVRTRLADLQANEALLISVG